ncbi:aldehyde dehydrogenase family protein [Ferrimonas lipolytica]|uniref:Aldehyde dehydrogenase family protein n=1 Tax=Ferrimonas lipolytica TaxID=2724191 RepID=A0A6H1UE71_9GAMM|nr:aldehyde dehydrogenase family protein [Ferrimonas lipolytica]QIZ77407.1 aldehyde dehydrogenase family protein [Ferrimonas lipolytica]
MIYSKPGTSDALFNFKKRYHNYIGGEWKEPVNGNYFDNPSPVDGSIICQIPRSDGDDINLALDAAHAAQAQWANSAVADRSNMLLKIADRIEQNLEQLAYVETWENGKAIRETLNADLPLCIDHFRYFAGVIRAQEGSIGQLDQHTTAYHFHEPIGVVGQIIPWNFPILMATWKLAPALAAGCSVVLKPAEQTPVSILILMELIGDLIPAGVVNIVNGMGDEAGQALASSTRINKLAFTGSTEIGQHIMRCGAESLIPVTLELGGKSPNVYFADIMDQPDAFFDKCLEGLLLGFFNQGEVCTCPSRALVEESIYPQFIEKIIERAQLIKQGNPLDTDTQVGAQVSQEQYDRIMSYMEVAKQDGAQFLLGGDKTQMPASLANGFYVQPTLLKGSNDMRVFQEEIFGPTLGITTFKDEAEALAIANDTTYGLGAGVWTRDQNRAYRMGRGIQAGRVWVNCYHLYPAHAAFGGYKKSGMGRETHLKALGNYQQTKNLLVSYDPNPLGFF